MKQYNCSDMIEKLKRCLLLEKRAFSDRHFSRLERIGFLKGKLIDRLRDYVFSNQISGGERAFLKEEILSLGEINDENIRLAAGKKEEICSLISNLGKTKMYCRN